VVEAAELEKGCKQFKPALAPVVEHDRPGAAPALHQVETRKVPQRLAHSASPAGELDREVDFGWQSQAGGVFLRDDSADENVRDAEHGTGRPRHWFGPLV
jgi:hypothetical protein